MRRKKDFIDKQSYFSSEVLWWKKAGPKKITYNATVTNPAQIQNITHFNTSPCAIEISSRGKSTDRKGFYSSVTFIKS